MKYKTKYKALGLVLCLSFLSLGAKENLVTSENIEIKEDITEARKIEVAEKLKSLIREEHNRVFKVISDFVKEYGDALDEYKGQDITFSFTINSVDANESNESRERIASDCNQCDDCTDCKEETCVKEDCIEGEGK